MFIRVHEIASTFSRISKAPIHLKPHNSPLAASNAEKHVYHNFRPLACFFQTDVHYEKLFQSGIKALV